MAHRFKRNSTATHARWPRIIRPRHCLVSAPLSRGTPGAHGDEVSLAALRQRGPVVLTFYHGRWSPFCMLTLCAYGQVLPHVKRYGASLVALSPQTLHNSAATATQQHLTYPVLSDLGNHVARQYGLVYQIAPDLKATLLQLGIDLAQYNASDAWELPLTATFIVAQNGQISLAYVRENFMQRLEPTAIIARLAAPTSP
jgi:peroxiredoxin